VENNARVLLAVQKVANKTMVTALQLEKKAVLQRQLRANKDICGALLDRLLSLDSLS
jgi:hypothetical protein